MAFCKKTSNLQRPRVDRFVATRDSLDAMRRRRSVDSECGREVVEIWDPKYLSRKKYANYLDEVFGVEPAPRANSQDGCCERDQEEHYVQPWPCVPRKRSYLSSADSVLDLPSYSYAIFPDLLDWSNDNILVAALGKKYYKWSWRTQKLISEGITRHTIHCCRFDPRGELLVLGTDCKMVEIHETALSKRISENICPCPEDVDCTRTTVDWSPTGNSFITGCTRGTVASYHRTGQRITWVQVAHEPIKAVRISPDARYVAIIALNNDQIIILSWPSLKIYLNLQSNWIVKTITWHPWRSALLGIGALTHDFKANVCLWDAPPGRIQKDLFLGYKQYNIDAMLFSHRTGELVLSLFNPDVFTGVGQRKACSQLLVMSDPETVVDQWGDNLFGLDRVKTMVFSPDGTKLATATADEDLIIWNFLPEDKSKTNTKPKRFSALPAYFDESSAEGPYVAIR